jgi:hypothetical protein
MDAALKQSRFQRMNMGRVHLIETEYLIALQRAELDWLRAVVADIREGRLSWVQAGDPEVSGTATTARSASSGQLPAQVPQAITG